MTRMKWDDKLRTYSLGLDRGVMFPPDGGAGVAWNGLVSVLESDDFDDISSEYVDGQKFSVNVSLGTYSAKIRSLTTPDEVFEYAGYSENLFSDQFKKPFSMTYRSFINTETDPGSRYQIHLVYNALVKSSGGSYLTLKDSSEVVVLEWDLTAKPIQIDGYFGSAHFIVDSAIAHPDTLEELEEIVYGSLDRDPRMPSFDELLDIFESGVILRIIDHGDGTWTAEGPDEAIQMIDETTFRITWPSAIYISSDTYMISSL